MPRRKGCHLTWNDRLTIEKMLRQGYSKPQIARYLGVHHSTIYEECRRGAVELVDSELRTYTTYSPEMGVAYHERAVKNMEKGLKIGKDHALASWLVEMISGGYSPSAACSLLGKTPETTFSCTLCRQTVYKYIERGELWPLTNKALRFKGTRKRKYSPVRRASRAPSGKSIERRPEIVKLRETPGDWEMDSVEGKKGTPEALLVLTERATRNEIMVRMEQKTAANVVAALDALELEMGPQMFRRVFRSITVDNGSEFADCAAWSAPASPARRAPTCTTATALPGRAGQQRKGKPDDTVALPQGNILRPCHPGAGARGPGLAQQLPPQNPGLEERRGPVPGVPCKRRLSLQKIFQRNSGFTIDICASYKNFSRNRNRAHARRRGHILIWS